MRNTLKVAKWEIKRNMKNKSFIIGLFITPLIFLFFMIAPSFFGNSEAETVTILVKDELNAIEDMNRMLEKSESLQWEVHETNDNEESILEQLYSAENTAYIHLTKSMLDEGIVTVYTSKGIDDLFVNQMNLLIEPLRQLQLQQLDLSAEELDVIMNGIAIKVESMDTKNATGEVLSETDPLERIIPGAFAGVILFSIVISGMMIFQSASQEKKEKIAEIILSSLTPSELMQGKIIGYFVLGIIQVFVWIFCAIPVLIWKFDIPILKYLFVPELAILLFIAILGYLLFASIFVGIGATIEDVSTSGNFQGMVLMLPFLPFILISPIINNPSGLVAKISSYIPITSPSVLIIRLSVLEEWPWLEIAIAVVILIVSVWLFMKLAGKIFKTGILLYGKNATPKEIWKWLWI